MIEVSKKILLLGAEGVGKTSLTKRFVYSLFDDSYLSSIGVKISKKKLTLESEIVNLIIWDIAGEMLDSKVYKRYLLGAKAAIFVFDVSRPETYEKAVADFKNIKKENKDIFVTLIGNKNDLEFDTTDFPESDLFTSAKTGNMVEDLFRTAAKMSL